MNKVVKTQGESIAIESKEVFKIVAEKRIAIRRRQLANIKDLELTESKLQQAFDTNHYSLKWIKEIIDGEKAMLVAFDKVPNEPIKETPKRKWWQWWGKA